MAEGLSPAENGPAPAVRQAPSDLAAPRPSLYRIEVPPVGRRRIYPIYPQLFISLTFDLALPAVGRRGHDMVLGFDNGGEVVLQGFVGIAETCPTLHLLPPDGSLLPGDYVAEALTELGEAPALPSEDGLAAQAAQPELTVTEPAQIEPVVPEPVVPEPVVLEPVVPEPVVPETGAPEAFAAEPASPPVQPSASLMAPRIEPPAEPTPGPVPTRPRPSPLSEQPEPEFPVEAILQDLEAQGVVPASAPALAEEAGSAAELVDQVTTALPDFPAAADSAPPHPAPEPPAIEPSELEPPEPEAPAADLTADPPPPQAWNAPAPPVEPADQIVDAEPPAPAAPEAAPAEWNHEAPQAAMAAEETWTQDIGVPDAEIPETAIPNAVVEGPQVEGPGVEDAGGLDAAIPDAAVPDAAVPDAFVPDAVDQAAGVPDAGNPEAEGLWAEQGETANAPEPDVPPLPDPVTEAPIPVAAEAGPDLEIPEPPLPVAFELEAADLAQQAVDQPPAAAEPEMTVMEAEIAPDAVWPGDASPEMVDPAQGVEDLLPGTAEPEMTVMEAEVAPDAVWHGDASPEMVDPAQEAVDQPPATAEPEMTVVEAKTVADAAWPGGALPEAADLAEEPAELPPATEETQMIGPEAAVAADPVWPDDAPPEALDLAAEPVAAMPVDLPHAADGPEMRGAETEFAADPVWPDDAPAEMPREVAPAGEVAWADAAVQADVPMADLEAWPEAVEDQPAMTEPQPAPVPLPVEPEMPLAAEPLAAAPAEPVVESHTESWAEDWAGETGQDEALQDPIAQDPAAMEMSLPPEPEATALPLEPMPVPIDELDTAAPEDTVADQVQPVAEAPVPEPWAPEVPIDQGHAEPQSLEPVTAPAAAIPDGPEAAATDAAPPLAATEDEAAPDPAPAAIAVPDFAALASQAGLELPTAPSAPPAPAPAPEEAPPMELFESPEALPPQEPLEAVPEAPTEASFEAPSRSPDAPPPPLADPQPPVRDAEPPAAVPAVGTLADATEETVPPEAAGETEAPAPGGGILRTAMASVLRAGNRILPSRGGEPEDVAAAITEAQEVVAAAKSVLDEEEVLELTQPAEMPLPAPPVTLPESAGTPLPPLEEGKPPAEDLDAIELFSDPLSYGAGVTESPAPIVEVRQPGAGRRLSPQEPLPTEVQDAVRLALHQMEGADLFEFAAEGEGAETAATPTEGTFTENPTPTSDSGTG